MGKLEVSGARWAPTIVNGIISHIYMALSMGNWGEPKPYL